MVHSQGTVTPPYSRACEDIATQAPPSSPVVSPRGCLRVVGERPAGSRTAVVGGGVSGLVAAAELVAAGHDVHLFEAGGHAGGHTNTVDVETADRHFAVDTGFIVFNELNYPNFERMLAELGIASQPADTSFSVSDEDGHFEWATRGLRGLFARPGHTLDPRFHRMFADLVRFNREARALLDLDGDGPSLRRFLADGRYSEYFVERLLIPQVSAVWSADPAQMWTFPARFLAAFFDNHRVLQLRDRPRWRTVSGGARRYVDALIDPFRSRIHLRDPVRRIRRHRESVTIELRGATERFDRVVIAVHSDQALRLLADPSAEEREVLGAIPYQRNEAVLHTDASLMPRRRMAWASWNYHLRERPADRTTVTYHMNRLQRLESDTDFLVTLNRTEAIDPRSVLRVIDYQHPVHTPGGLRAQRRWAEISGRRRTHYCGAYWGWGFHEDGIWSALRVAQALGGRGPLSTVDEPAGTGTAGPQPVLADAA